MNRSGNLVNSTINQSAGKAQRAEALSLPSFFASLSTSAAVLGVGFALFILLKDRYVKIYQPRLYASLDHHPSALRTGPISWLIPFFKLADDDILGLCGIDSYLFLRYLKTMVLLYGPLSLVVVPPLLSLNLIKAPGNLRWTGGMDQLSWSNMSTTDTAHLWGHFCCAICIVSYSCFMIHSELNFYLRFLQKSEYRKHVTSIYSKWHLVLLTDIPKGMRSKDELRNFFSPKIPGQIPAIEVLHDMRVLSASIATRNVKNAELERAETLLIKKAHVNLKTREVKAMILKLSPSFHAERAKICSLREELATLNRFIKKAQHRSSSYPQKSSAIFQFSSKFLAQAVADWINHPFPNRMLTHDLGSRMDDIIWSNLGSTWWERQLRSMLVSILSVALVVGWTVPIAFTGMLSQLGYLAELFPWLSWVSTLPVWFIAFLQGVLPQIALSILMIIFPEVLRAMIKQRRLFTKTAVEISLQKYYFAFLFIHLFLTVSISSGIVTVLAELLNSPKLGPTILARNLPKASNYFISYILFQALSISGSVFGQPVGTFSYALHSIQATTPREQATKANNVSRISWGTFFPVYTTMSCIVMVFSAIAPIILIIGSFAFILLWVAHRYSCLFVNRPEFDNGGRLYPNALFQLFSGLYVLQLCLVGLFALSQDVHSGRRFVPQAGAMVLALVITAVYHRKLVEMYSPIFSGKVMDDLPDEEIDLPTRQAKAEAPCRGKDQIRHPALTAKCPVVWIPQDRQGVSDDEIRETRKIYGSTIPISSDGATLDRKGIVVCQGLEPPSQESLMHTKLRIS